MHPINILIYDVLEGFFFNAKYTSTCSTVKHWYLIHTYDSFAQFLSNSRNAAIKVNVSELLN